MTKLSSILAAMFLVAACLIAYFQTAAEGDPPLPTLAIDE
jgi:hypothetical protein